MNRFGLKRSPKRLSHALGLFETNIFSLESRNLVVPGSITWKVREGPWANIFRVWLVPLKDIEITDSLSCALVHHDNATRVYKQGERHERPDVLIARAIEPGEGNALNAAKRATFEGIGVRIFLR
jgi:hypothetical protein